MPDLEPVAI